jgi:hypothetical protein
MTLHRRLVKLEQAAVPYKPNFCIDVIHEPTPEEWREINAAHDDGRVVFAFRRNATIGVWLVGYPAILWS